MGPRKGVNAMFNAILQIYIDVIRILTQQARPQRYEPECGERK
jgi:hypothetical protein